MLEGRRFFRRTCRRNSRRGSRSEYRSAFPWESLFGLSVVDFLRNSTILRKSISCIHTTLANRSNFSPFLTTEDKGSSSSSVHLAETFAPGPTLRAPSSSLQQDSHDEGVTIGFEPSSSHQRTPNPKATSSEGLSTTRSDRTSCQVCNKQFSRNYELRYVPPPARLHHAPYIKC